MQNQLMRGLIGTVLVAGMLGGCGGGDDAPPSSDPGTPTDPGTPPESGTKSISGTIVVPEGTQAQSAKIVRATAVHGSARVAAAAAASCPDVPVSYVPLSNASISFQDAKGAALGVTLATDECGKFSGDVPDDTAFAVAAASGYRSLTVPVETFAASGANLLSVLPDVSGAGYRLASMQLTGAKLYFTVVDTLTGKAALGVPSSALHFAIGNAGTATDLKSLTYAASGGGSGNATTVLALDASGSMTASVVDAGGNVVEDGNGVAMTGYRMAAAASHAFLDGKRADDEVGVVVFDSKTTWIDQAYLGGARLQSGGAAYAPAYAADGFTTAADDLRLPVDYYNYYSTIWSSGNVDAPHAPLPADLRSTGYYPWSGSTAVYSAGQLALDKIKDRGNSRKIVVLLTDGEDNASSISSTTLAANFQAAGVPLWTVSFGQGTNTTTLQKLADDTGGNYIASTDTSALAADFAAIQTGIVFQYIGELGVADSVLNAAKGQPLTLSLDYGGDTVERSVIVQP